MEAKALALGLTGYPLLQSLSPRLHTAGLQQMGRAGEYRLYPIPALPEGAEQMAGLMARLKAGELHGLNVTIPHKQAVLPYLDELTAQAQAIGAVNTLYCRAGRLIGDNTDAPGFLCDLRRILKEQGVQQIAGGQALVLGAGGAARAVAYALWQGGWQTSVCARRPEQAAALAAGLERASRAAAGSLTWLPLEAAALQKYLANATQAAQIIVNASSAGMLPDTAACPWPEGLPLPRGWLVYDLVYKPRQTELMRRARAAGLPACNGLGMLVEQAALALETWSGQPVARQALWQAIQD